MVFKLKKWIHLHDQWLIFSDLSSFPLFSSESTKATLKPQQSQFSMDFFMCVPFVFIVKEFNKQKYEQDHIVWFSLPYTGEL